MWRGWRPHQLLLVVEVQSVDPFALVDLVVGGLPVVGEDASSRASRSRSSSESGASFAVGGGVEVHARWVHAFPGKRLQLAERCIDLADESPGSSSPKSGAFEAGQLGSHLLQALDARRRSTPRCVGCPSISPGPIGAAKPGVSPSLPTVSSWPIRSRKWLISGSLLCGDNVRGGRRFTQARQHTIGASSAARKSGEFR